MMRKTTTWLLSGLLASLTFATAQGQTVTQGTVRRHLVYFRDKTGTP
jgi:hypothetical protein